MLTEQGFTPRTADQILGRINELDPNDFFAFRLDVLIPTLDWEHAQPYLVGTATEDAWEGDTNTWVHLYNNTVEYIKFGLGKAENHRGASALRTIAKLNAWCWLLGDDTNAVYNAPYPSYGVPGIMVAAGLLGVTVQLSPTLLRMSQGLPCVEGCQEGCLS